jgi:hypothetical protein
LNRECKRYKCVLIFLFFQYFINRIWGERFRRYVTYKKGKRKEKKGKYEWDPLTIVYFDNLKNESLNKYKKKFKNGNFFIDVYFDNLENESLNKYKKKIKNGNFFYRCVLLPLYKKN